MLSATCLPCVVHPPYALCPLPSTCTACPPTPFCRVVRCSLLPSCPTPPCIVLPPTCLPSSPSPPHLVMLSTTLSCLAMSTPRSHGAIHRPPPTRQHCQCLTSTSSSYPRLLLSSHLLPALAVVSSKTLATPPLLPQLPPCQQAKTPILAKMPRHLLWLQQLCWCKGTVWIAPHDGTAAAPPSLPRHKRSPARYWRGPLQGQQGGTGLPLSQQ
jgi:hypothetical protein